MIGERDFSKVTFKVNAAGSWAKLVTVDISRIDEVKAACAVIGNGTGVRFKYVDAEGGTIEQFGYVQTGTHGYCWHEPKRWR